MFLELASAWCVFIAMHRRQDSARARLLAEAAEERRQAEQRVATTTQELRSSLRVLRAYVQALARELEAPAPDLALMRQLTEQMEGTLAQVEAFVNRLAASPRE